MLFAVPAGEGRKPAQAISDSEALNAESKKFVDYARDFYMSMKDLTPI
jgi:hypothetical protein